MPAIHLFRGLPLVLVPIGFHCNILLGVFLYIRITWPSQAILLHLWILLYLHFLLVRLVHNSFWFSRIHLHFALGQRFFSIFYAQIFWDVVCRHLFTSKLHIRRLLQVLLNFYIFLTLRSGGVYSPIMSFISAFNPLNAELNPICNLLALLGAHHFLHVSRIRVKSLTLRLLMSYIYIWSTYSWCF